MECQCSLPVEKENRLKACVRQLEPSHNTREQLLTPLLLSRHRYLFAGALKRDKTCWIKFLIDSEFRHLWVRATLIYLQAAATVSFSLLSSFKCPHLCVWMTIIPLDCSQCPSWVKLIKNGCCLPFKGAICNCQPHILNECRPYFVNEPPNVYSQQWIFQTSNLAY